MGTFARLSLQSLTISSLENRDVRGGSTRPLLTRLPARLPRERLPRTRGLFDALIGLSFSSPAESPFYAFFFRDATLFF
jgi:hypothetical protein